MPVAREAFTLRRSAALPLLAFGLAASLTAGCTSTAEPGPLPSPSSSPSASTSSAIPPTLPPEAEGTSAQAAKAFARFYVESVNYAMATGDVDSLEELSTSDCQACQVISSGVEDAYADGGRLEGDGWQLRSAQYLRLGSDRALVGLALLISKQARYDGPDSRPVWSKPTRGHMDLRMSQATGQWRIFDLEATQ